MDRESFDRQLLEHLSAAQRFAVRLTGDPVLAEDVLHDAIVRAANNSAGFRGQSRFTTWFFQIIVNCFRDQLRKSRPEALDERTPEAAAIDPSVAADRDELAELVARRVSALPPRQREVLVLVAYERMNLTETAQVLGISEQNARTNLSYARQRLKRELAAYLDASVRGK